MTHSFFIPKSKGKFEMLKVFTFVIPVFVIILLAFRPVERTEEMENEGLYIYDMDGDGTAPLVFYVWKDGEWDENVLMDSVYDGHSINIVDYNDDGYLDVFLAEMELGNNPDTPKAWVFLGNGMGDFEKVELLSGFGWHESMMVDLDGDGDLDILGKPYTWEAPRLDIWLNKGTTSRNDAFNKDNWKRSVKIK